MSVQTRYSYIKKIPKKKNGSKPLILLFCLTIIIFAIVAFYPNQQTKVIPQTTPTPSPLTNTQKVSPSPTGTLTDQQITAILTTQINKFPGDYGVFIKNLKTNKTYSINPNDEFTTASIYKLAVMYKIFDLLEKNQLSYSSKVATGTTVENALNLMITVSDNDSALALADTAGWNNIQSFLDSTGVSGFHLQQKTPTATANAVATLLEKIYRGQAVSIVTSQKMMDLLLGQKINDRIPKYLPSDVKVAHKTGELDLVRNDAGIVFGKKSDYIFVFLSSTPAPGDTAENIAQLAKTMYNALEE